MILMVLTVVEASAAKESRRDALAGVSNLGASEFWSCIFTPVLNVGNC